MPTVVSTVERHTLTRIGATVHEPGQTSGRDIQVTMQVGDIPRTYVVFVPNRRQARPALIIFLHGLHQFANDSERTTGLDQVALRRGLLVAYPSGFDESWNAGRCCGQASATGVDDVGFLVAVVADLEDRYAVDERRIAIAGFSNGGMMAYRFACERSDLVSSIVVGSATSVARHCAYRRPVSVLAMHGLADATVPYQGASTSPLTTDGVLPSVPSTVTAVAHRDGCAPAWRPARMTDRVTRIAVGRCAPGTAVTVLTASSVGHAWVTGARAIPAYDETRALTLWLDAVWARR